MQLREYLAILARYWPLILALPLIAAGLSLALALAQPPSYQASARLMVTHSLVAPSPAGDLPDYNDNSSWLTSEYILDDLPLVVNSISFGEDVAAALAERGLAVAPSSVAAGMSAQILHRSVYLRAVAPSPEQALATVEAAVAALRDNGLKYWGRGGDGGGGLDVGVLDPPGGVGPTSGPRDLLVSVGLRAALGLAAGLGLAMLLHYLDDRLRSRGQAERWTGARVLAVIPKER